MKKNLLFITADQWRGECLSILGHLVQTKNLDELAKHGTLFTRCYSSTAPCGPSRASMHTSLYQHQHGVTFNDVPLKATRTNWAMELRKHGITPVLFGYTDTVLDRSGSREAVLEASRREGVLPGLEPIVELGKTLTAIEPWVDWLEARDYPLPERHVDLYRQKKNSRDWEDGAAIPNPLSIPARLHDTYFMVDQVLEYIANRSEWCIHLSLLRPHPPWSAPEPYNSMYPPNELNDYIRPNSADTERGIHPYLDHAIGMHEEFVRSGEQTGRMLRQKASYFGLMSEVDANLGRLFKALRESGAWDRTLIVFTSDHGEQLGDHWLIGKLGYFDQSYHVPLIIRKPTDEDDPNEGRTFDGFVEGVDIAPTILDWYGIQSPEEFAGRSLLPVVDDGEWDSNWRNEAHWEFDFSREVNPRALDVAKSEANLGVVRTEFAKYVYFPSLPPVLYDLGADRFETRSVATEPSCKALLADMKDRYFDWLSKTPA